MPLSLTSKQKTQVTACDNNPDVIQLFAQQHATWETILYHRVLYVSRKWCKNYRSGIAATSKDYGQPQFVVSMQSQVMRLIPSMHKGICREVALMHWDTWCIESLEIIISNMNPQRRTLQRSWKNIVVKIVLRLPLVMHYMMCYFVYNVGFFLSFLCFLLRVTVCKVVLWHRLKEMTSKID